MWIREISDVEMDMLGVVPGQPKEESSSSSTSSQTKGGGDKLQVLQGPGRIEGLGKNEIQSKEFKAALRGGGDAFLARLTPAQMKVITSDPDLILDDELIEPAKDSEEGIKRALGGFKSIRTKIAMLQVAYDFLEGMGKIDAKNFQEAVKRKGGKVDKKAVKKAAADVAGAVAWKTAVTAFPILAIVKGVAQKVIDKTLEAMKLSYNNRCGGKAGETVGDFSDVGGAGRLDGKCAAAEGEPKWVSEGFKPYLWRNALGLSKWTYSPLGFTGNKRDIKDVLDARKKRGKKAPPKFKKGGKNDLRPPAAYRED